MGHPTAASGMSLTVYYVLDGMIMKDNIIVPGTDGLV